MTQDILVDLSGGSASCFEIGADNITFDCAGHSITETGAGQSGREIYILASSGITVKNCVVNGFGDGILLLNSAGPITIEGNTLNGNTFGIRVENSAHNSVLNNAAVGNTRGIYLSSAPYNTVTGNNASNSVADGFDLIGSNSNTISNNRFCSSATLDVYSAGSSSNTASANACTTTSGFSCNAAC
ncbi:right-handed parallel beta-helix repeat-containing protein [Candidatus Micrarchaeota archaeon]|nr:right-handed parallel beta-helix repeat-containing protein [Candidatus Micrarchaeota archaeon]